jgi:hypothetical protein
LSRRGNSVGWGHHRSGQYSAETTALATLASWRQLDAPARTSILDYWKSHQFPDGGWSSIAPLSSRGNWPTAIIAKPECVPGLRINRCKLQCPKKRTAHAVQGSPRHRAQRGASRKMSARCLWCSLRCPLHGSRTALHLHRKWSKRYSPEPGWQVRETPARAPDHIYRVSMLQCSLRWV